MATNRNTRSGIYGVNHVAPEPQGLVAYVSNATGRVLAIGLDFEPPFPQSEPHTAHKLPLGSNVEVGQPFTA